jgi:hypothetical protein
LPLGAVGAVVEGVPLAVVLVTGTPGTNSSQPQVVAVQVLLKAVARRFCACGRTVALGGSAVLSV